MQSRILWWPEASLATRKGNPRASSLCVRAPCIYTPRSHLRGSELEEDIMLIGVDDPFVARLALWYGGASSTPCEASNSAEGSVKESRHRSGRFLRCAPAGIGRVACRTAGERVPLQARTVQRFALALAGEEDEPRRPPPHALMRE